MTTGYRRAIFLTACIALVFMFSAVMTPVRAEDLSRYCGHPIDVGRHVKIVGKPLDPGTCRANCFRFTLICNNGRSFSLTSRYTPYNPDWLHFLTLIYPFPQILVFGLIGFLTFVMWQGKAPSLAANLTYLGIVGAAMYMWPNLSTSAPLTIEADLAGFPLGFSILGLPIFLVLNVKALARGWNYVFIRHPVAPIVLPALRDGTAIDTKAVAKTLAAGAYDRGAYAAYHYENQAEKAHALKERLDADAAAAEVLRRREEARAELAEAERHLQEVKRRAGRT